MFVYYMPSHRIFNLEIIKEKFRRIPKINKILAGETLLFKFFIYKH